MSGKNPNKARAAKRNSTSHELRASVDMQSDQAGMRTRDVHHHIHQHPQSAHQRVHHHHHHDDNMQASSTHSSTATTSAVSPATTDRHHQHQHQHQPPQPNPAKKKRRRQTFCVRTREKERIKEQHLTLDVMQLQQEIQRFQAVRDILANRTRLAQKVKSDSFMRIIRDFYDTFRYGFLTPFAAKKQLIGKVCTYDQSEFLASIVHHDVCSGRFQGVDVLMDQWSRYANFVAFLNLQMLQSEMIDLNHLPIVHTVAELHLRFTRMSIKKVFPHLIGQDQLMQKVVGLEIKCPARIVFCFGEHEKIVRLDYSMEYAMALNGAGLKVDEVVKVLSGAKISEEGFLGDLPASYRRSMELAARARPVPRFGSLSRKVDDQGWSTTNETHTRSECHATLQDGREYEVLI